MKEGRAPESGEKAPRAPSPASKLATRESTSEKSQDKGPSEDSKFTLIKCIQIKLWFNLKLRLKPGLGHQKKQHVTK